MLSNQFSNTEFQGRLKRKIFFIAIHGEIITREETVEFHLDHTYTKIGLPMRMLAGVWAMQHVILVETREIPS